ncbi:MAG: hypothetical protein FJX29_03955 [Alphaproteobacteria bacterium]|nr:hypothetical protein [Alphaproteobacteria bacterium]
MMKHPEDNPGYIIVTGAFERDNFGDILFGEIALSVLNKFPIILASLISNSMEAFGSRTVASLLDFAAANRGYPPAMIVHAGGEILSCSLTEVVPVSETGA